MLTQAVPASSIPNEVLLATCSLLFSLCAATQAISLAKIAFASALHVAKSCLPPDHVLVGSSEKYLNSIFASQDKAGNETGSLLGGGCEGPHSETFADAAAGGFGEEAEDGAELGKESLDEDTSEG